MTTGTAAPNASHSDRFMPSPSLLARLLIFIVRVYRLTLSPLLGPSCRFEPSCSRYSMECLRSFGAIRGSWLSLRRIAKCQPFHPGGYDPPPQNGVKTPTTTCASAACNSQAAQLADTPDKNEDVLTIQPPHARPPEGTHE